MQRIYYRLLFIILIASCLQSCRNTSRQAEILEEFRQVNSALDSVKNARINKRDAALIAIRGIDTTASKKGKDIVHRANEVLRLSGVASAYIDSVIGKIEAIPTSDADKEPTHVVLLRGADGIRMEKELKAYITAIDSIMRPYPTGQPIPMNIAPPPATGAKSASWRVAWFTGIPSFAATTILNKFNKDIEATQKMCLERLAHEKP